MEKQLESSHERPQTAQHDSRRRTSTRFVLIAAAIYISFYAFNTEGTWFPLGGRTSRTHQTDNAEFSWEAVESKPHLDWSQCYDSFQCARLELPMDYFNGTTNDTVSIALIKKPAAVPVTHPQYGGAVLHNPGGPGGSGVFFLLRSGAGLQQIVGSPDGLQYDHVSFDPRGIGYSTPQVECFRSSSAELFWIARVFEEGLYSSSDAAFGRLWSMATAEGGSCSLPPEDGSADIKQYVNTAFVARDMLEIVERHGEWREAEAKRLLQNNGYKGRTQAALQHDAATVTDKLKYRKGEEKINYWGFSYGSYLGNTFAAMFPDRIHRLIVDGVVDAYDYRQALWLDNLHDTDKDLGLLYYHCARVGYPKCALANATGETTAAGVEARIQNISSTLYHNPLPIISRNQPGIVTYSDIKGMLFAALYAPIQLFPRVADVLVEIESGNYGSDARNQNQAIAALFGSGAGLAIACSDGDSQDHISKEDFREHVRKLEKLSPVLGEVWSAIRLGCIHWKVRSHYRFTGDWVAKTAHPILEIGNTAYVTLCFEGSEGAFQRVSPCKSPSGGLKRSKTLRSSHLSRAIGATSSPSPFYLDIFVLTFGRDPVTPGRYARKMARGFVGAVALIQDSPGHCSSAAKSNCTESYIRQYFQTGKLPEEGTVCAVDELPFGGPDKNDASDPEAQKLRHHQSTGRDAAYVANGVFGRQ